MNRGYLHLWRKLRDSSIIKDPHLLQCWIWILTKAAWKTESVTVRTGRGKTTITLTPGQFLYGRNAMAADLNCHPSNIRNRLDILRRRKMVDIQPDRHYSIVSIINWELYQSECNKVGQASGQASGQPKDNQRTHRSIKALKNKSYTHEFEKFWSVYPRRIRKQIAFAAWVKVVVLYPPTDIISAAEEYAAECERERREERYIMYPSTFLNKDRWKDYCFSEVAGVN